MFFCLHNGVVGYYTLHSTQCPAIMLQLICLLGNANVDGGVRNASFNLLMGDKLIAVISLTKDYENVSLIDISIGFFEDMENKSQGQGKVGYFSKERANESERLDNF